MGAFSLIVVINLLNRLCVAKMENESREIVDLYIPRKCSETNDILAAKDHAAVQINFVDLDASGVRTNTFKTYAICGRVRRMGQSDDSIMRLAQRDAIMPKKIGKEDRILIGTKAKLPCSISRNLLC